MVTKRNFEESDSRKRERGLRCKNNLLIIVDNIMKLLKLRLNSKNGYYE